MNISAKTSGDFNSSDSSGYRSLDNSWQDSAKQCYSGQLNIDVKTVGSHICVRLTAAEIPKVTAEATYFLEISILPASKFQSRSITSVQHSQCKAVLDEKFMVDLPLNFESKRLKIAAWSCKADGTVAGCLGCMSFSLQRALSEPRIASGWYYILDESLGNERHKNVDSHSLRPDNYLHLDNISRVLVCKIAGRFGFSLLDSSPAVIHNVSDHSSARHHNVREGDVILCIDNVNVSRMTTSEVLTILQNIDLFAFLTIRRSPNFTCDENEDKIKNEIVSKHVKDFYGGAQKQFVLKDSRFETVALHSYGWIDVPRAQNLSLDPTGDGCVVANQSNLNTKKKLSLQGKNGRIHDEAAGFRKSK